MSENIRDSILKPNLGRRHDDPPRFKPHSGSPTEDLSARKTFELGGLAGDSRVETPEYKEWAENFKTSGALSFDEYWAKKRGDPVKAPAQRRKQARELPAPVCVGCNESDFNVGVAGQ